MSSSHSGSGNEARSRAVQRLRTAVAERGRALDVQEARSGTEDTIDERTSLRAADEQVEARRRWLEAVDDHAY